VVGDVLEDGDRPAQEGDAEVHEQLQLLEAAGRTELELLSIDDCDGEDPVRSALEALDVMSVDVFDAVPPGTIVLCSIDAGAWGWNHLEDAIELCAATKARQLANAEPEIERILFVWIDSSRQDLFAALDRWSDPSVGPPPRTMVLPDVVDTVIVG
jgi:hypothetical protein